MNGKRIWLGGVAAALLGLGTAWGQGPALPYPPANGPGPLPPTPVPGLPGAPAGGPPGLVNGRPQLSDYIAGAGSRGPCCCGPLGFDGPVGTEVFVRPGISFPVGGDNLSNRLDVGWSIEGGARVLLFDPGHQAAWTSSFSVSNVFNPADTDRGPVNLRDVRVRLPRDQQFGQQNSVVVPSLDVLPRSYNRTYANAAFGREWYLVGDDRGGGAWDMRVGVDVGGGWGTSKLNAVGVTHRTDVIGRFFLAAHGDVEVPFGALALLAGMRFEWSYTWSDVLQRQNNADIRELGLQFTLGTRF